MDMQYNDIGVPLVLRIHRKNGDTEVLMGSASDMYIILLPPSGAHRVKAASFHTDGSDGMIEYETVSGDLNQQGRWGIQGLFTLGTKTVRTSVRHFNVKRNI